MAKKSDRLSLKEVAGIVSDAVINANASYADMSGGLTIHDSGIEPYVSGCIGRALCSAGRDRGGDVFATLETPFNLIAEWSRSTATRGAKPSALRRKGRVDVVYYDSDGSAAGLIEVKRHFAWSHLQDDVKRLVSLLARNGSARGGSLRWGCVVGFHSHYETTRKDIIARMQTFTDEFRRAYPGMLIQEHCESNETPVGSHFRERTLTHFYAPTVVFAQAPS